MPIVNDELKEEQVQDASQPLLEWVTERVDRWRDHRDTNYKSKWDEYYRLWRGIWIDSDKNRESEKSRLISPALQQAVEAAVSEIEEAIFGSEEWFDAHPAYDDVVAQQNPNLIVQYRRQLKDDLERAKAKNSVAEVALNGAIYGTGIGEIVVEIKEQRIPVDIPVPGALPGTASRQVQTTKFINVKVVPVAPQNFVIDPSARSVDEALGVAIEEFVPKHVVLSGMKDGTYIEADIGTNSDEEDLYAKGEFAEESNDDRTKLIKYYGLVPKKLLDEFNKDTNTYDDLLSDDDSQDDSDTEEEDDEDDTEYVESLIVIANDNAVIKCEKSPYMMEDRPIIAYQHDRVPQRFWGRGVCEKGYNPQKALDSELRARMDALALTTHPMMALDATRLPRGSKFQVKPGATILTNGDPRSILMPFQFGGLNGVTFQQSQDFERQIQMGTGQMDVASQLGQSGAANTLGGMSLAQQASIKRQKRTLLNFQENFFIPMIQKVSWRYMQFDPKRYPALDFKFMPTGTMGIMARELEQAQLTQMMGLVPQATPPFFLLLKSLCANSSIANRDELTQSIDMLVQQMQQPNPMQQQKQQVDMMFTKSQADLNYAKIQEMTQIKPQLEVAKIQSAANQPAPQQQDNTPDLALKIKELEQDLAIAQMDFAVKTRHLDIQEQKLHMDNAAGHTKMQLDHVAKHNQMQTQYDIANLNTESDNNTNDDGTN